MRVAVIGSRSLKIDLEGLIPKEATAIISGGAVGIDTNAKEYAIRHNLELIEFLPDYEKYARYAPLKRNDQIIESADLVIAIWEGKSKGTKYVIDKCEKQNKRIKVILCESRKDRP